MKKILSILLVLMLTLALTIPMTVSAVPMDTPATDLEDAYLEKEFKKDENLANPNTTFTFTFTKKALNDESATDATSVDVGSETVGSRVTAAMPTISDVTWNTANATATAPTGGKGTVAVVADATTNGTMYFRIPLEDILPAFDTAGDPDEKFAHAGIYKYTVAETTGSATGIEYSTMVYTLVIAVDNSGDIVVTVLNAGETAKYDPTITNIDDPTTQSEFVFTNILTKKSELKIGKTVADNTAAASAGDYGDRTKLFPFTTTLTTPSTQLVASTTMLAHIYDASNTDTGRTVEFTFNASGVGTVTEYNGATSTFYELRHGEYLHFWNDTANTNDTRLPVGTTYTVGETLSAGQLYTPSAVTFVDNVGTDGTYSKTGTAGELLAGGSITVNEATTLVGEELNNSTIVTNTAEYITPTGILMMVLPFAIMIAIAAGGIFMLVFIKRRKAAK